MKTSFVKVMILKNVILTSFGVYEDLMKRNKFLLIKKTWLIKYFKFLHQLFSKEKLK